MKMLFERNPSKILFSEGDEESVKKSNCNYRLIGDLMMERWIVF